MITYTVHNRRAGTGAERDEYDLCDLCIQGLNKASPKFKVEKRIRKGMGTRVCLFVGISSLFLVFPLFTPLNKHLPCTRYVLQKRRTCHATSLLAAPLTSLPPFSCAHSSRTSRFAFFTPLRPVWTLACCGGWHGFYLTLTSSGRAGRYQLGALAEDVGAWTGSRE